MNFLGKGVITIKASMKDVAKHANVSVATVSHVINNSRYVSEETRNKVYKSIEALGYVPDPMARSFKTGKKNLIGIVVPDIANTVWAIIIEEVEGILAKSGYKLLIVNTKETESRERDNLRLLSSGMVDGIILASTLSDYSEVAACVPKDFPMVFIDRELKGCTCDTIIPQDYTAVYDGVKEMLMHGHKKIGFISGLMRLSTSVNRLNAYRDALSDFGMDIDESLICYGNSMSQSAVPLVRELLEKDCTGIVVSNNVMLDDVLFYLDSQDICPGEELELLGQAVEGRRNYLAKRSVSLILQPSKDIGRTAAKQILERINDPSLPIRNTVLHSTLI